MTQEEKQILLQDLSARLPYGVKISKANVIYPMTGINIALGYVELAVSERLLIEEARPYLRPMSSMTEEEREDFYQNVLDMDIEDVRYENDGKLPLPYNQKDKFIWFENIYLDDTFAVIDWLNAHHFDYRGLIPMGLALEAPEGMYKTKYV